MTSCPDDVASTGPARAACPDRAFHQREDTGKCTGLDLRPLDEAVPSARLHARIVLHEWGMGVIASAAELIVSELVTNAVRFAAEHARGAEPAPVRLRLTEQRYGVLIEVWDADPRMPQPGPDRAAAPDVAPGGRGLILVKAYSARWGFYPTAAGGKVVWSVVAT